jgi:hypothetical protein
LPSDFDAISVDIYAGTLLPSGLPNHNSTCPTPALEANCVFQYLRSNVYPHISTKQKVFVVPGLYGSGLNPIYPKPGVVDEATDHTLTAKFDLYWQLAVKDPHVVSTQWSTPCGTCTYAVHTCSPHTERQAQRACS